MLVELWHVSHIVTLTWTLQMVFFFGGARSQSGANADAQTTKTDESKSRLYNIVRAYIFSIFNVHLGDLESMYIYIYIICVCGAPYTHLRPGVDDES